MTRRKLISVVIPAYNYALTLPRAVESVLPQLSDLSELVVIDDGSTDSTPNVIETLLATHPGSFRAVRKENGGLASVRNRGIDLAEGEYLVFLDADDELHEQALESLVSHIVANPSTRFVAGGHLSIHEDGKTRLTLPGPLSDRPVERVKAYLLDKSVSLANGACAMHRGVFLKARYPEEFRSAEDVPVFAQVLANFDCTSLDVPIAKVYKHNDSLRHNLDYAKAGGMKLVDEVFNPARLGPEFHHLYKPYRAQRCLSLFRSAYLAKDMKAAKEYYSEALRQDASILLKWAYTKKAARVFLGFV